MYFLLAVAVDFPPRPARPVWSDLDCFIPMVGVADADRAVVAGAADEAAEAVVVEAALVALGVVAGVEAVVETPTFSFSPLSCFLMVLEEQIC